MDNSQQFECADCRGETDPETSEELTNGELVCCRCAVWYFRCAHCDENAQRSNRQAVREDDEEICDKCAGRHYTYSGVQSCYVADESTVTLCDTDEVVSDSWAEENAYQSEGGEFYQYEDSVASNTLHDYGEDVLEWCEYNRESLENGALAFGVELEMESRRNSSQEEIAEALGSRTTERYILKEDESLDYGVELVCIPLTLEEHRTVFDWQGVLEPVQHIAVSGPGTKNCGMHVHINKAALTPLQIGKMLVFLNSPLMRRHITTVAQRESNEYCKRSAKKLTDGRGCSADRHDIVNVGHETVEVRMFRGTLKAKRVLKNIEFCHALVMYCRDTSLNSLECWEVFASWLIERRGQYPNLVRFLAEKEDPCFVGAVRPRPTQPEEILACA